VARAVYRGYWQGGRRSARVTRLHVIREDSPGRVRVQTWCGQGAGTHRNSEPVIFDPMPAAPPEGLKWCPQCIGHLAEQCGVLGDVAARLAAREPGRAS
jgi:hypothetical protein